jgi:hypothetical protein
MRRNIVAAVVILVGLVLYSAVLARGERATYIPVILGMPGTPAPSRTPSPTVTSVPTVPTALGITATFTSSPTPYLQTSPLPGITATFTSSPSPKTTQAGTPFSIRTIRTPGSTYTPAPALTQTPIPTVVMVDVGIGSFIEVELPVTFEGYFVGSGAKR